MGLMGLMAMGLTAHVGMRVADAEAGVEHGGKGDGGVGRAAGEVVGGEGRGRGVDEGAGAAAGTEG